MHMPNCTVLMNYTRKLFKREKMDDYSDSYNLRLFINEEVKAERGIGVLITYDHVLYRRVRHS